MDPYQTNQQNYGFYNQQPPPGNYPPAAYDPNQPQYGQTYGQNYAQSNYPPQGYPGGGYPQAQPSVPYQPYGAQPPYNPQGYGQPQPYGQPPGSGFGQPHSSGPPQATAGYQPPTSGYPVPDQGQGSTGPYSGGGFTQPGTYTTAGDGSYSTGGGYTPSSSDPYPIEVKSSITKLDRPQLTSIWNDFSRTDKWFHDDGSIDIDLHKNFPFKNTYYDAPWYSDFYSNKKPRHYDSNQYGWNYSGDTPTFGPRTGISNINFDRDRYRTDRHGPSASDNSKIGSRDIPITIRTSHEKSDNHSNRIKPHHKPTAPTFPHRISRDDQNNEKNKRVKPARPKQPVTLTRLGRRKRSLVAQGTLGSCYARAKLYDQNYDDIVQHCRRRRILFEDPMFLTVPDSIFYSSRRQSRFVWKRPGEVCDKPEFFLEGASRFDVKQGALGDCWLLAAIASLTCNEKLLYRVVPPQQNFGDDYCGIFKFMFWHQGTWIEVVVDDRLPTYHNNRGEDELVFMHSADKNEFWSALLEKAYAKLNGSYEALKGGSTNEAMEDFTGGVTESIDLKQPPKNFLQLLMKAHERNSLMGCSIDPKSGQIEAEDTRTGLVEGHAYSVTSVKMVSANIRGNVGKIPLLRIRNPWGNDREWKGAWSDNSREWAVLSDEEKRSMGLTYEDDGEFWMSFTDFCKYFDKIEICNLGPDSLDEEDLTNSKTKKWEVTIDQGNWIPQQSAGGCRNFLPTFWTNPQFRISVTDPDDDDDDDLCTVIIGVLQKDRRKKRREGLDMLTIGYVVYALKDNPSGEPLGEDFFKYNASCAKSPSFVNMREMCGRHQFAPGSYLIVPSTFEPHQKGEYLLRIFTEKANITSEMDEQTGYAEDQSAGDGPPPIPSDDNDDDDTPPLPPSAPPEMTSKDQDMEDKLAILFKKISGEDMEIDALELQKILNDTFRQEFTFEGFSLDSCRTMVAMHDGDMSGMLGFDEFKTLWNDLRKWKSVFKKFDADNTGSLDSKELRNAFHHVGFKVSNRTFTCLVKRYSRKSKDSDIGEIMFADFVSCAVRLKTMIETFRSMDTGNGNATFSMDDFVQTTMYS